jgi:CelD/BcsL family acetyltransferase involved in cellulose biosynthesis
VIMRDIENTEIARQNRGMQVEVLQCPEALTRLSKDWDDLFERDIDAPPYLSRAWISAFVREGRLQGTPLFIAVYDERKLVALLGLTIRKFLGIKIAEPIGMKEPSYLGVLSDPVYPSAIQHMADFIADKSGIGLLCFQNVSSMDQKTEELIVKLRQRRFLCRSVMRNLCFSIQLPCSFDEYLQKTKSTGQRKKLRKEKRRLSRYGQVQLLRYEAAEISSKILHRIAVIHEESWLKRRGANMLIQPFYQKLLMEMARAGFGKVWLITIDGEDAAFKYALVAHGRLHLQWTAFKLKYASSLSVGKILTMMTIQDVCNDSIFSIDFGHGDSPHKRFWATDSHEVSRVAAGRGFIGVLTILGLVTVWSLARNQWLRKQYRGFKRKIKEVRNSLFSKSISAGVHSD